MFAIRKWKRGRPKAEKVGLPTEVCTKCSQISVGSGQRSGRFGAINKLSGVGWRGIATTSRASRLSGHRGRRHHVPLLDSSASHPADRTSIPTTTTTAKRSNLSRDSPRSMRAPTSPTRLMTIRRGDRHRLPLSPPPHHLNHERHQDVSHTGLGVGVETSSQIVARPSDFAVIPPSIRNLTSVAPIDLSFLVNGQFLAIFFTFVI